MEEEKKKQIVCIIKFLLIFDNEGKLIFGKYFNGMNDNSKQKDFEKKICLASKNVNVSQEEIDIFNYEEFNIICKISEGIGIFVGIDENENEALAANFFKTYENNLLTILNQRMNKENILNNYKNILILTDEMVNEGVIMNTDIESLKKLINLREENSGSQFISFGNAGSSGGLFGSIFSGAKSIFS